MKRLCAVLIQEWPKMNTNYIASMIKAWNDAGVQTCIAARDTGLGMRLGQHTEPDLAQIIRYAREGQFEELILMTDELMGPVYPLEEILQRMDACQEQVWQLARQAPMFGVGADCWDALEGVGTLTDFTQVCDRKEISVKELYNTSDWKELTAVPMLDEPLALVRDRKCPFFLHEVFHRDYTDVITTTLGHQGQVFYQWLYRKSGWNIDLLWDYLLPTCHQQDYFRNLQLTYILPTRGANHTWLKSHLQEHKLALVMHLYYPDKLAESCAFASRFPENTHVIITTSDDVKKELIRKAFADSKFASLDVRVIANRGRDVSALLVGAAEVFDEYDYVCFFHDKKTLQTKPGSIGAGFAYRLQENMFATADYVCNMIQLFHQNHRLGMIAPPAPHHGDYFFTLGTDWGPNYERTRELARKLGFHAPIAVNRMPVAALGTCFWFRGKALKPLSDFHWKYEDFPPEPNNADGTILHAIERIYSFACVEAGFYPAFAMSDRYAGIEYSSLRYYVRGFNQLCVNHGIMSYHKNMCEELDKRLKH